MKRAIPLLVLCLMSMATAALAQGSRADISANLTGVFGQTVTGNGIQQTQTNSAGGLLSFRYFVNRYAGIEGNYSYTRNSQDYNFGFGNVVGVKAGVHEVTGAFVLRHARGPIQPFVLAGGGVLVFSPTSSAVTSTGLSISRENRPTFLYGLGTDLKLAKSVGLRVQYRGLLYQAPDFHDTADLHTGQTTHTAVPSVGLVFKF